MIAIVAAGAVVVLVLELLDVGPEPGSDHASEPPESEEEEEELPSEGEREWRELLQRDGQRSKRAVSSSTGNKQLLEHDGFVYFGGEILGRVHEMPSSSFTTETRVLVMCHKHISCSMDIVLRGGMDKTAIHKWLLAGRRFSNADDHCKVCFIIRSLLLHQHVDFGCKHIRILTSLFFVRELINHFHSVRL